MLDYIMIENQIINILKTSNKPLSKKDIKKYTNVSIYVITKALKNLHFRNKIDKEYNLMDCRSHLYSSH